MRNTEKRLPLCAAIAALVLSGVLVLTPAGAFADSSAPSPSPTSPPPADPEPPTPSPSPTPDATSSPAAEDSALSTPSPAPKDSAPSTPTPTMSAAPEEQASRLLVADAVAVTTFTNVTELADAFASASGNAWIVLSQTLTGTTSDPAVSLHPGANVTFDLAGHSLTLTRNDEMPAMGVPAGATLTIIDSVGGAVLTLDNTGTGAGLGGAGSDTPTTGPGVGHIVVSGVTVKATSSSGAAIGAGVRGGTGGTITIADKSNVTATSSGAAGTGAAGIGGAFQSGGGTVNIQSGSVVVASGSKGSAGIGNAQDANDSTTIAIDPVLNTTGTVTTVTATGGSNAAGIGNGVGTNLDADLTVTIGGGAVHATGQGDGAGIGSGTGAYPPRMTVNGGQVVAVGGSSGPGIGPGAGQYMGDFGLTIGPGGYVEPSSPSGVAVATSQWSDIIISGTLTIPANNSMTNPGDDWILAGTLNVDGSVNNQGRIINTGTINVAGTFVNGFIFNNPGSVINVTGTFDNESGTITAKGTVNGSPRVTGHNTMVTLHGNGGTPPAPPATPVYAATFDAGEVDFPGNAVRAGFTFAGWFSAETGGTKVTSTTDLFGGGPKTIPLYAQWTPVSVGTPGAGDNGDGSTGSGSGSGGTTTGPGSTSSAQASGASESSLASTGSNAAPWVLGGGIALLAAGAAATAIAAMRRKRAF